MTGAASLLSRIRALFGAAKDAGVGMSLFVANDPSSGISDDEFRLACLACDIQLQRDVAPAWGLPLPSVTPMAAGQPDPRTGPHGAVLVVVGSIPQDPGAQGFHTPLGDGTPFGGYQADGFISTEGIDEDGFSEVLSHELCETTVDPTCAWTEIAPDGTIWPVEVGDQVQAQDDHQRVEIVIGAESVWVANFTLPAAYGLVRPIPAGSLARGPFDFLGALSAPWTIGPYGYAALTPRGSKTATDVFGPSMQPAQLADRKVSADARVQQRVRRMGDGSGVRASQR